MPLVKPKVSDGGDDGGQRGSRPPWVRQDGPPALPMPSAPWLPKRRESQTKPPTQKPVVNAVPLKRPDEPKGKNAPLKRQETEVDSNDIEPVQKKVPEKTVKVVPMKRPDTETDSKVKVVPIKRQDSEAESKGKIVPIKRAENEADSRAKVVPIKRPDSETDTKSRVAPNKRPEFEGPPKLRPVPFKKQETEMDSKPKPFPLKRQETEVDPKPKPVPFKRVEPEADSRTKVAPPKKPGVDMDIKIEPILKPVPRQDKNVNLPTHQPSWLKEIRDELKGIQKQDSKAGKAEAPRKKVQIGELPETVMDKPVPPPPAPPAPPPPPPPAPSSKPPLDLKPLSVSQKAKIEALKSRPRRRPDWTDMMKEVEEGVKLKHVMCNDRSAPVIPKAKAKGQFVYESEKGNAHNLLLKEIQGGVRLKKVKCNDRSKPILDGLRKFRRQMTIEEQIVKKSTSMADVVAMAAQPDELDDIDKVRDDLQSTKQMLAHELRNKETLERENKRLLARLVNLEAELEKEKATRSSKGGEPVQRTDEDDKLISKLKDEAAESSKMMKQIEDMYKKTAEELDVTRSKLEKAWLHNAQMEQELKNVRNHPDAPPPLLPKMPSSKKLANASFATNAVLASSSEEESEEEESEEESSEEEDGGANTVAQQEKRTARELKLAAAKLKSVKEKKHNAKKEKVALRQQFSNLTKALSSEKKKYKRLQKEVDKMAKLVKDVEEEEEEEPEEDEEDELEESDSENESEESEDSEDSEGDLPESASSQDKIANYTRRLKRSENRLTTLKKCNYLLKANIDRRQDEINKQKEVILSLQEDLNAVLAELG